MSRWWRCARELLRSLRAMMEQFLKMQGLALHLLKLFAQFMKAIDHLRWVQSLAVWLQWNDICHVSLQV